MVVIEREIIILELSNGKVPFEIWYEKLDSYLQSAVDARISRLSAGNFGDSKPLGNKVYELIIPKGPGLRIYYSILTSKAVLLINGGDKSSQTKDISIAKILLRKFKNEI